ncbi:peroxisomal 2,4-dienoyl-CoA reductase [Meleagris gallopavo]|uniref:peroxisomal 2,4-dienoyl-CoA reductase n=1 Tax=Meleagris gallopavo TaxID=9103 RepID=UPI00093F5761|nr:peroxisomal 2,4-dienoyl-CoA reductase [Meleagris gallopavo]
MPFLWAELWGTGQEVKELTKYLDPSGLGVISFEDFHRGIRAIRNGGELGAVLLMGRAVLCVLGAVVLTVAGRDEPRLRPVFDALDRDGDGFVRVEEFVQFATAYGIAGRNQQRVAEASKKLVAATGQQCLPLSVDVRQPQTIMAAVDETLKQFKQIDILVNGAAGNFLCPASALSFNAFKTVMDIDTLGTFNTSKVLFEKYFRDHGGVIINITATLSYRGQALQVHAGSAKAAIDAMTRHLAVEWGPNNIRVNSLAPGPITGTEGFRRLGGKFAKDSNQFDTIPLQRAGNKTEIAHSALYLASPLSSYVTGTTLVVDGGSWLTSANSFSALLDVWAAGANKNQ